MKKEQEQQSAKYTPSGKRKIKAKVLTGSDAAASIFSQASTGPQELPATSERLEKMKYRQTQKDYQEETKQEPLKFDESEEKPEEQDRDLPKHNVPFKPTDEDFRKK